MAYLVDRENRGKKDKMSVPTIPEAPVPVTSAGTSVPKNETIEQTYLRQTRTATCFIAVCVGIVMVLSLIGVIVVAKSFSTLNNTINGTTSTSNCFSQGGTDPSC
jgi:hypothetical protein